MMDVLIIGGNLILLLRHNLKNESSLHTLTFNLLWKI